MPQPLGRIRACSECRWQKLKCDASEDYSKPCSRCRRMGLECEIARNTRKTQRKTKAELARENARLQEQLENNDQPQPQTDQDARTSSSRSFDTARGLHSPTRSRHDQDTDYPAFPDLSNVENATINCPPNTSADSSLSYGSPSTLSTKQIGQRKIDDCFALFFRRYEPLIPGLFDTSATPDQYLELSPLLFWAIVVTGARGYSGDPTLHERIVRQVSQMALEGLFSMTNLIPTIEAVLILCLWPTPVSTMFKDPSHALAGTAMQLAILNGLHIFGHEQDFVRQSIESVNSEVCLRFRLWVHCVTIFQSTNLIGGLPCWTIPEAASLDTYLALDESLPTSLQYMYSLHRIQTDAIDAITKSVQLTQRDCGPPLNSLVGFFDAQVRAVSPPPNTPLCFIAQQSARLSIKAFHFFAAPDSTRTAGLIQLYSIACNVINLSFDQDKSHEFSIHCTQYHIRMVVLSAMSILRLSRSPLKEYIDVEDGEAAYFKAIALSKKRSTENNDLDSRNATILTQLWASSTVFVANDGIWRGDQLRLRSRLFMSIVFDTFWHWRAIFGGWRSNPYAPNTDDPSIPAAQNQGAGDNGWEMQDTSIVPLQSWEAPVPINSVTYENIPPEFSYFPAGDWSAGMSFADPTSTSLPHAHRQMPVFHDMG